MTQSIPGRTGTWTFDGLSALETAERHEGLGSILFLVACAACGDGRGAPVDAAALEGEWLFSFEETAVDCEPETGGAFQLAIHVDHTLTDILSDDVHVSGRWHAPMDQEAWSVVEGVFDLDRGELELTLWGAQRFAGAPRILIWHSRGPADFLRPL